MGNFPIVLSTSLVVIARISRSVVQWYYGVSISLRQPDTPTQHFLLCHTGVTQLRLLATVG